MKIKKVFDHPTFRVMHDSKPVKVGDEIEVNEQTGENYLKKGFERVTVTSTPKAAEPKKRASRAASVEE